MNKYLEKFLVHVGQLLILYAMLIVLMAPCAAAIELAKYLELEEWQVLLFALGSLTVSVPALFTLIDMISDWAHKYREDHS